MEYDLQFVDSITANPAVRIDFTLPPWAPQSSTSFGMPEMQRAVSSTLLTDGDRYPASAYGNRIVTLVCQIHAESEDETAAVLQILYRELDRSANILRYRPGTSAPVFFRTFRCGPESVRWDPGHKEVTASIPAEPFALGLPETIGPVTVYNDPAAVGASLLANGTFEAGIGLWTAQNGAVAQSSTQARSGTYSLRLTPTGGLSPVAARAEQVAVTAGVAYRAQAWVWAAAGWSDVSCAIDWLDGGGSLLSTSGASGTALASTVWEQRVQDAVAPVGAVFARLRVRMGGTPAAGNLLYVDDVSMGERGGVGSNGMFADLAGIRGDVETPLRITMSQSGGLVAADQMSLLAVRRRGTPSQTPFVLQAEAMTQETDTTTQAAAEDASGTGNRWSRTTFASGTASANRLSMGVWPTSNTPDVRGRYRVLARIRTTNPGDTIYAQIRWGLGFTSAGAGEVSVGWDGSTGSTNWRFVDLGLISFPSGADPGADGLTGLPLSARGQTLVVEARRQLGSGSLDWDYLLFVPADDRLAIIRWGDIATASGQVVIDGTTETIYPITSAGVVYGGGTPPSTTAWPMVSPGVTNRLYWLRSVGPLGADIVTSTTDLLIEYSPLYLFVRPVSS